MKTRTPHSKHIRIPLLNRKAIYLLSAAALFIVGASMFYLLLFGRNAPPDSAPTIVIEYPEVVNKAHLELAVQLNQPATLELTNIDGHVTPIGEHFSFDLQEGENSYSLRATNKDGISSTVLLQIFLDTTIPQITLDPSTPTSTKESHITLSAAVADNHQLQKIFLGTEEIVTTDVSFQLQKEIELEPGNNPIEIKVVDAAGNESMITISILREASAVLAAQSNKPPDGTANWWTYPSEILPATKSGDDLLVLVNKKYQLPSAYSPNGLVSAGNSGIRIVSSSLVRDIIITDLTELGNAATADGIDLAIISGYRSYQTQAATYQGWVNSYNGDVSAADKISARAGHSQHQLGTTIDFTTSECGN